ncbi:Dgri\GH16542-PA-like protein [Anopheles sinensis]|uniref:Dgri\GH16542-PA-like protein n=1 Tax=Anopheles sinensis TaxID=74873 RepID=A0A084WCU8_ANOSI|nr:Dgri\GH16542-PA-like protein [Anopheles sinensis]
MGHSIRKTSYLHLPPGQCAHLPGYQPQPSKGYKTTNPILPMRERHKRHKAYPKDSPKEKECGGGRNAGDVIECLLLARPQRLPVVCSSLCAHPARSVRSEMK